MSDLRVLGVKMPIILQSFEDTDSLPCFVLCHFEFNSFGFRATAR